MTQIKEGTKSLPRVSLGFYTPYEASRIAQVPKQTVNSWRRNGIIIPSVEWIDEQEKAHTGHTFETVVFMRLIRLFREKNITLYKAVIAMQEIKNRFGPPSKKWAEAKIFVDREDVCVYDNKDTWDTTIVTRYNQKLAEFVFGEEFTLLKERADALLIPSQFMEFVEIDPSIQNGLPILFDTTILTSTVHKLRLRDYEFTDIQRMYPFIPDSKIMGAEEYETFLDKVSFN